MAQEWLKPPYYIRPNPMERVDCGPFFGSQPTAEARMQDNTYQILSWVPAFVFGSPDNTPAKLEKEILNFATVELVQTPFAKLTAADFQASARAKFHYDLIISTLEKIPVSNWIWDQSGSVYDYWVAKTK